MGRWGSRWAGERSARGQGQGWVVVVSRTVLCLQPIAQANGIRVEEFHVSAGNHCKGPDLPRRRQNTKKGRSIQAGQTDPGVQGPPGDLVGPLVQESQGGPGFLVDSPQKALLALGGLWDLEFQCPDFLSLPSHQLNLALLVSRAHLHFLGSPGHLGVLAHQGFPGSPASQALQEAPGWSALMTSGWESG